MVRDDEPQLTPADSLNRKRALVEDTDSHYETHRRFDRMARLIGEPALEVLFRSHVMVIGLGGVGSFAAESLVRSGVGTVSVVDFDKVCVTNANRQLQAVSTNIGRPKAESLAERLRLINPAATILAVPEFYCESNAEQLLNPRPAFVVDAIDNITAKCHLLATCRSRAIPIVSSLGAAGRSDPTLITIADLARSKRDPMGRVIRKILRQKYEFPHAGPFGISAVYSTELPREPEPVTYDGGRGFRCVCPGGGNELHSCEKRRVIYGTASYVTGAFGLFCASQVVRQLTLR